MFSAMMLLAMTAAPGADKKSDRKVLNSRVDCVTQAEMKMFSECVDGFGLDAEEYELLMSQDYDMMDDMSMTFTVPTCAGGDVPSLNGAGAGGWQDPPIIRIRTHGGVTRDDVNGNTRPGSAPSLDGGRPGGWDNPPIGLRPYIVVTNDETNSGFDSQVKGNTRPGGTVSE